MDQEKQIAITSLFEVVSSIERKWANEWNNHNVLGFSKSHILILDYLSQEGPKRPSAIAERLKVTTGGVTVLTSKLINAGFIEKTQHATDRRASQLKITTDGEDILEESRQQVSAIIQNMFGMLSADEVQTLRDIFAKLLNAEPNRYE
ncbi:MULTISPECIES: MarR family winged helix-turn-helix transcriptional regulator [Lysinibacillus]|jgi:DNA-binding MarR family transcriptional regulator|uniref:MarR family transcriptional regulator n=2 Tax=Lysinibacillus xylanilyticus TaxID=582475 RepID=A0A0K9F495_9BACI|nr:MarR family transcriptional regulator [Lysinibacillus xylanilyticus]KMY28982.1 RNA polymerase sigma factor [Lysinibacillus xylanilyticus]PJO40712.1 MarR family transcriptional regulator [Lysinibacillus xylanilyticus]QPQ32593.1 MarR family transcriptional regulator [Lysinibacillus sp. JNUCC-51]